MIWNLSFIQGRQEKKTYFLRWKPPRIRADNFWQGEHIHEIVAMPFLESLLNDLVVASFSPRHLGQMDKTTC